MEEKIFLAELEKKMQGALEALARNFDSLRVGRANPAMIAGVSVMAYGARQRLENLATISAPDARMLSVSVWDGGLVSAVERAIVEANLDFNPQTEGQIIRLRLPEMSEERRLDMVKAAAKHAEAARVSARGVRRDGMASLRDAEKDSEISEDVSKRLAMSLQKLTDRFIGAIDEALAKKEQDMTAM